MESSQPARILVVANRTVVTDDLIEAIRKRSQAGPCTFMLLVPAFAHGLHRLVNPQDQGPDEAERVLAHAIPLLERETGQKFRGVVGDYEPLGAIEDALNLYGFDEVIISTLPHRISHWLHSDLPRKVKGLGLPVTVVTASRWRGDGQD
jgi:hypothetical protein